MTSLLNCLRPSSSPSPHLPEAVLSLTQQHGMPARDEHQVRRCWICTIRHCSTRRLTSTRVIYTTRYLLRIGFHATPAFSPGRGMRAPYMQDMHSRGGKNISAEEKTKGFASLTRPTLRSLLLSIFCCRRMIQRSDRFENDFGAACLHWFALVCTGDWAASETRQSSETVSKPLVKYFSSLRLSVNDMWQTLPLYL